MSVRQLSVTMMSADDEVAAGTEADAPTSTPTVPATVTALGVTRGAQQRVRHRVEDAAQYRPCLTH